MNCWSCGKHSSELHTCTRCGHGFCDACHDSFDSGVCAACHKVDAMRDTANTMRAELETDRMSAMVPEQEWVGVIYSCECLNKVIRLVEERNALIVYSSERGRLSVASVFPHSQRNKAIEYAVRYSRGGRP
jgi:hypothetical protein